MQLHLLGQPAYGAVLVRDKDMFQGLELEILDALGIPQVD
jgi:hypothetical protein